MFVMECLSINSKGNLQIGGCDCVDLAREFGTPLYVLDEGQIRKIAENSMVPLINTITRTDSVLYACKALCTTALCRIAEKKVPGLMLCPAEKFIRL